MNIEDNIYVENYGNDSAIINLAAPAELNNPLSNEVAIV